MRKGTLAMGLSDTRVFLIANGLWLVNWPSRQFIAAVAQIVLRLLFQAFSSSSAHRAMFLSYRKRLKAFSSGP